MSYYDVPKTLRTLIKNERTERKKGYLLGLIFSVVLIVSGVLIPFNGAALSMGIGFGFATIVYALHDLTQHSVEERNLN